MTDYHESIMTEDAYIERALKDMRQRSDATPGMIDIPLGWRKLIADLHLELIAIDPNYGLHQVKQKFAGLRFYAGRSTPNTLTYKLDPFYQAISRAEEMSYTVCEISGTSGVRMINRGYIRTLNPEYAPEGFKSTDKEE